jgi:hypothetical protein
MKYLKDYSMFTETARNNIDYSAEYPLSFKNVGIPPAQKNIDDPTGEKNSNFQAIQQKFQELLLGVLQKDASKNYQMNDAIQKSDEFFNQTKGKIKEIIDENQGDVEKTVQKLLKEYEKKIQVNQIEPAKQLNQPQQTQEMPEMSRE